MFSEPPLYYAEPGSAVERAFLEILPLIDADRSYPQLFNWLGVKRLIPGQTVAEELMNADRARPARSLAKSIVNDLAPYLLSVLMAKSDKVDQVERDLLLRKLNKRFEVKALDELTVSFGLHDNPSVTETVSFPNFYLRIQIQPGTGITKYERYTLFHAGDENQSIYDVDPDALGEALVPIFQDNPSAEIAANFPRIVTRYCQRRGDSTGVEEFLHRQLNVTKELIEEAKALMMGDAPQPIAHPPALKIIERKNTFQTEDEVDLQKELEKHRAKMGDKAKGILLDLVQKDRNGPPLSPEQVRRGLRGEEEVKRRLLQPEGWEGFSLLKDRRAHGVGYDFLCNREGREVKVEVKTFAPNGRVVVSNGEPKQAALSRSDYYLIGLLDDEGPDYYWDTFLIRDPMPALLAFGEFNITPELHVTASKIFEITGD